METVINSLLLVGGIYLAMGLIFSLFFLWKGVEKVDENTQGAGLFFKLLLLPGMCAFWPLFLKKWIQTNKA